MKLNTKYLKNYLTKTLTFSKNFISYILLHIFMLACIFMGGYLLIDLLISKWWIILELICWTSMFIAGILMTLTAIELNK